MLHFLNYFIQRKPTHSLRPGNCVHTLYKHGTYMHVCHTRLSARPQHGQAGQPLFTIRRSVSTYPQNTIPLFSWPSSPFAPSRIPRLLCCMNVQPHPSSFSSGPHLLSPNIFSTQILPTTPPLGHRTITIPERLTLKAAL
jgi:hypothetical protein